MKKPRLLLIYPSVLYAHNWGKRYFVKAQMINLFSFLRHHKIKVDVLDLENEIGRPEIHKEVEGFRKKALKLISQFNFDIAAISCWSSLNYLSSIMVAEICKTVNTKGTVVVGGYHPSALPSDFMYEKSPFDFIVRGEGEIALLKICKGEEDKDVKPRLIQGMPLDLRENFLLDWQDYKYAEPSRKYSIYLSRGCPFYCAYCMESIKGHTGWRSYTVDKAIREIKRLINSKEPRQISIADACFGYNKIWRKDFLSELIKNKISEIFWAESRIDLFDKEDIDLLAKLNFNIEFGVESGSEAILYIMKKTKNPKGYLERCKDIIDYADKKEVPYRIGLIFNYPGETLETYTSSINFFRSLVDGKDKISGFISGQNYLFFPGNDIHTNLRYYEMKHGTIVKHKEWWKEQGKHHDLAQCIIPSRELIDKKDLRDYWYKDIENLYREAFERMPVPVKIFWYAKEAFNKQMFLK